MISNIIPLCVYPALATPGKFVVSSANTGNVLAIDDVFGSEEKTRYFDSIPDAQRYVDGLNKRLDTMKAQRRYQVTYQ